MKKITCFQMGGPKTCPEITSVQNAQDMIQSALAHFKISHKSLYKKIQGATPKQDREWVAAMKKRYTAATEKAKGTITQVKHRKDVVVQYSGKKPNKKGAVKALTKQQRIKLFQSCVTKLTAFQKKHPKNPGLDTTQMQLAYLIKVEKGVKVDLKLLKYTFLESLAKSEIGDENATLCKLICTASDQAKLMADEH